MKFLKAKEKCDCGSGLPSFPLYDARGIFVSYICAGCEKSVKAKYRPEIFTNPTYWADEPIEEDE